MFYKITSLFPILNYDKSVAQTDLFKLQCVKRVISQSLVINTNSDVYACLGSFHLYRSRDQQNKKHRQKRHGHEKDIKLLQIRSSSLF